MEELKCQVYQEWMSLAQDGQLGSAESQKLHQHLSACPVCGAQWVAMNIVSQMLRTMPIVGPAPGFMQRLQARMVYREEKRRRLMVGILLSVGVLALSLLALPSLLSLIGLTGQLLLPYWIVVYVQQVLQWVYMALSSLSDVAWLLLRNFSTTSSGIACISSVVIAFALFTLWVPFMMRRMATHPVK